MGLEYLHVFLIRQTIRVHSNIPRAFSLVLYSYFDCYFLILCYNISITGIPAIFYAQRYLGCLRKGSIAQKNEALNPKIRGWVNYYRRFSKIAITRSWVFGIHMVSWLFHRGRAP
ncbi:group II intron maturase-specific domain-containing protein [Fulvitalea axinellae]|uniref:group II intron maturase-specific domain-containing protein n=1 Tax=Fulvitalea axinellae TaxID=1182444 RepID=UPI003BAADDD0